MVVWSFTTYLISNELDGTEDYLIFERSSPETASLSRDLACHSTEPLEVYGRRSELGTASETLVGDAFGAESRGISRK